MAVCIFSLGSVLGIGKFYHEGGIFRGAVAACRFSRWFSGTKTPAGSLRYVLMMVGPIVIWDVAGIFFVGAGRDASGTGGGGLAGGVFWFGF